MKVPANYLLYILIMSNNSDNHLLAAKLFVSNKLPRDALWLQTSVLERPCLARALATSKERRLEATEGSSLTLNTGVAA